MVTWRALVWLCMMFMVWSMVEPMRMGLLHLQKGVLGGQDIISVGYLEDIKALKAHGGASTWLNHRVSTGWTKWFYSPRKCSVWTGSAGFCLGRLGAKSILLVCGCRRVFCQPWRWLLVELPIVSRRHLDRYSLLFRSFFACSSFGPRSVFDRLTTKQRETNERRTRT